MKPSPRWAAAAAVCAAALLAPLLLSETQLPVYIVLVLAACVVTGLSMLMGYAGQVSLGQAAFFMIGGYTAALIALPTSPR